MLIYLLFIWVFGFLILSLLIFVFYLKIKRLFGFIKLEIFFVYFFGFLNYKMYLLEKEFFFGNLEIMGI